jgi:hypothetical protein
VVRSKSPVYYHGCGRWQDGDEEGRRWEGVEYARIISESIFLTILCCRTLIEVKDPYHEKVPSKRLGVSYMKKQFKPLHPGLTPDESEILTKVRDRAYKLDMYFNFCGLGRYGWSAVVGLIPV